MRHKNLLIAALLLFLAPPASAQETAPGASCTAGEIHQFREVGGPETTGVHRTLYCNGSTWQQRLTVLTDGKVGIGADAPASVLEIAANGYGGPLTISRTSASAQDAYILFDPPTGAYSLTNPRWDLGISAGSPSFNLAVFTDVTPSRVITALPSGNVGILSETPTAPLDVNGEVRVGETTLACGAETDGTLRYTGDDPAWVYCDGSAWIPFEHAGSSGPACTDDTALSCTLDVTRTTSDPEFDPANILQGVNILGVTGTLDVPDSCDDNDTAQCILSQIRLQADPDFIAQNICTGANLLGVTGTNPKCQAVPTLITSGLVLHLDATSLSSLGDGGLVGTWTDQSGAGNNGTASSTSRPVFRTNAGSLGNPVVDFVSNDAITLPSGLFNIQLGTTFIASRADGAGYHIGKPLTSQNARWIIEHTDTPAATLRNYVGSQTNTVGDDGSWRVRALRADGNTKTVFLDGAQASTFSNTRPDVAGASYIGNSSAGGFSFPALTGQTVSTQIMSGTTVIVQGIDKPVTAFVSGAGNPEISINGGPWVSSGTINNTEGLRVRLTTGAAHNTMHSVTVQVGDQTATWSVRTQLDGSPTLINAQHSSNECTALGGTVQDIGSGQLICHFIAANCPAEWTAQPEWAAWDARSCGGGSCGANRTCTTASQTYQDLAPPTCQYRAWSGSVVCTGGSWVTCTANVRSEVGCF